MNGLIIILIRYRTEVTTIGLHSIGSKFPKFIICAVFVTASWKISRIRQRYLFKTFKRHIDTIIFHITATVLDVLDVFVYITFHK